MRLSEPEKAYVLALVYDHIVNDNTSLSWVPGYTVMRWGNDIETSRCARIAGHYRMRPYLKKLVCAIPCVTKLEKLTTYTVVEPPMKTAKRRWTEDGIIIPVTERRYEWY